MLGERSGVMYTTKHKTGMVASVIMVFAMAFTMLVASASSVFATSAYDFHLRVEAWQANGHEPTPRYRGDVSAQSPYPLEPEPFLPENALPFDASYKHLNR